ncbi:hypothetical protein KW529_22080, partial [Vibrio fluvialis]|nr:hypothetical protein [Vibrio fluvialis]
PERNCKNVFRCQLASKPCGDWLALYLIRSLKITRDLSKTSRKLAQLFKFNKLDKGARSFQIIVFAILCK